MCSGDLVVEVEAAGDGWLRHATAEYLGKDSRLRLKALPFTLLTANHRLTQRLTQEGESSDLSPFGDNNACRHILAAHTLAHTYMAHTRV